MREPSYQFYATDKDIYDLMACAKQKLTEGVLRDVARERGIFFSMHESRDELVDAISQMPFMLNELLDLMGRREMSRRNEKTTTIVLDADISIDDLKLAAEEYKALVGKSEQVDFHKKGSFGFALSVEYDEMDYSRTRLIQRQRHDAALEFTQQDGCVKIRLPATDKAKQVVHELTNHVERHRRVIIERREIELPLSFSSDERTGFFTRLISELPGFKLHGVTNLKIAPSKRDDGDESEDVEDDEQEEAQQEMLVVVRSMALNGENLIASKEYRSLRERGFYITSITWKARRVGIPFDVAHLHAEFEDGVNGRGFKYSAKGMFRFQGGSYTKTARPIDEEEREELFKLIDTTARKIIIDMGKLSAISSSAGEIVP